MQNIFIAYSYISEPKTKLPSNIWQKSTRIFIWHQLGRFTFFNKKLNMESIEYFSSFLLFEFRIFMEFLSLHSNLPSLRLFSILNVDCFIYVYFIYDYCDYCLFMIYFIHLSQVQKLHSFNKFSCLKYLIILHILQGIQILQQCHRVNSLCSHVFMCACVCIVRVFVIFCHLDMALACGLSLVERKLRKCAWRERKCCYLLPVNCSRPVRPYGYVAVGQRSSRTSVRQPRKAHSFPPHSLAALGHYTFRAAYFWAQPRDE